MNGKIEPYRESRNLPEGLGVHTLISEGAISRSDFKKVTQYQKKTFHQLTEIVAAARYRLFEIQSKEAISKEDAIKKEISDLEDEISAFDNHVQKDVYNNSFNPNGFGPERCSRINELYRVFESDGLTERIKQVLPEYDTIAANNPQLRGIICFKKLKKLQGLLNGVDANRQAESKKPKTAEQRIKRVREIARQHKCKIDEALGIFHKEMGEVIYISRDSFHSAEYNLRNRRSS